MVSSSVFEEGHTSVISFSIQPASENKLPKLLILTPVVQTSSHVFPVLLFFHGFTTENVWYTQLLKHIASHGYIIVAPQLRIPTRGSRPSSICLRLVTERMPENVQADLTKVAVSGYSRGGKTAFSLALGRQGKEAPPSSSLKFTVVIGIDPVAGISPLIRTDPKILTYIPQSFDLSGIPTAVIGTGLGNQSKGHTPAFAPDGVNHAEFWNESKPPCYYFLAKEYGHCDMLDDEGPPWWLIDQVCLTASGPRDLMRRSVGGIVVAFLEAYLGGNKQHLQYIVDGKLVAPIILHPILSLENASS